MFDQVLSQSLGSVKSGASSQLLILHIDNVVCDIDKRRGIRLRGGGERERERKRERGRERRGERRRDREKERKSKR